MNKAELNPDFVARALLVSGQYEDLLREAEGVCRIIPLKGISLLRSVYAGSMDRRVGDIDILVAPEDGAVAFIEALTRAGYGLQFGHLHDRKALLAKRKIALRARNPLETDIDIHLDFITKKFFRRHCGRFNGDCMERCRPTGSSEWRMDPVDEWLFLAQHAAFHRFTDDKWLRDLRVVYSGFDETQRAVLTERAVLYGMDRIRRLCLRLMTDDADGVAVDSYDRFIDRMLHGRLNKAVRKTRDVLWEIIMMDRGASRASAQVDFLFPSTSVLKAIYRTQSAAKAEILRIPHTLAAAMALAVCSLTRVYLLMVK